MTDLYAVIGFPIAHSRSPTMMNAAFAALGIDATYAALEVRPDQLRGAIDGIRAQGLAGLNVTIPHKEAILALCDDLAPSARLVGAVNTLARGERGLTGHNTDAAGFVDALGQAGHEPRGGRAVILGAGARLGPSPSDWPAPEPPRSRLRPAPRTGRGASSRI